MRRGVACLVGLVALTMAGAASGTVPERTTLPREHVLLVTPAGKPVGGIWQRWASEAKVPTGHGTVRLMPDTICAAPGAPLIDGCSSWGPPWMLAAADRGSLYFELGHLFDERYLTWHDRKALSRHWGAYGAPWRDSRRRLDEGMEDGLSVDFAAAYAECADGSVRSGYLEAGLAPSIRLTIATCAFIRLVNSGHTSSAPQASPARSSGS